MTARAPAQPPAAGYISSSDSDDDDDEKEAKKATKREKKGTHSQHCPLMALLPFCRCDPTSRKAAA